jgi:hypothetical protein
MTSCRSVSSLLVLLIGPLLASGCDAVLERLREEADRIKVGRPPAPDSGEGVATPARPPAGMSVPEPIDASPVCKVDSDCRLFSDYCTGCDCRALGLGEPDPVCAGPGVRCLANPCANKIASCLGGSCLVQSAPGPSRCDPPVVAGDDDTCRSQSEWKEGAYAACRKEGKVLRDFSVGGGDCGPNLTRQAKYVCCEELTVSPPPN